MYFLSDKAISLKQGFEQNTGQRQKLKNIKEMFTFGVYWFIILVVVGEEESQDWSGRVGERERETAPSGTGSVGNRLSIDRNAYLGFF